MSAPEKWITLFRGLNVGGKNRAPMAELRRMIEDLGFDGVQTYIQSGNAVFQAQGAQAELAQRIEKGFLDAFGFESAVVLRSAAEWAEVMADLPFSQEDIRRALEKSPEVEHLYVFFLSASMGTEQSDQLETLSAACAGEDQLRVRQGGKEVYLLCNQSIRDCKLMGPLAKLKIPMTSRNWKTVERLKEMVDS